jgi:hypothetical protein
MYLSQAVSGFPYYNTVLIITLNPSNKDHHLRLCAQIHSLTLSGGRSDDLLVIKPVT